MKKYILILLIITSCSHSEKKMRIANTSVNDVYDNFIFDFDDSKKGLKMINDYVEKDIQESKKFSDSLVKKLEGLSDAEVEKFWKENNLPTKATNVSVYLTREDLNLDIENNTDLLMTYIVDEDSFQITDFKINDKTENNSVKINHKIVDENNSNFIIQEEDITISILSNIKKQIDSLKFHFSSDQYTYWIKNNNEKLLVKILFKDKGTKVSLIYD